MVLAVGVAGEVTLPGAVPVVTGFNPQQGRPGTQVSVEGSGFTDASSVQFNNTFADFVVVSTADLSLREDIPGLSSAKPATFTEAKTSLQRFLDEHPGQRGQVQVVRRPTARAL